MKEIRIAEAFNRAWEGTKNNWAMLLALFAIYIAVSIANSSVQKLIVGQDGGLMTAFVGLGGALLGFLISIVFGLLLIKFSLRVAEENGAKVELFSEMELNGGEIIRYLLTYLLMMIVLSVAMAVCMAPVVVLGVVTVGAAVLSPHSGAWKALIGPGLVCVALAGVVLTYLSLSLSQMIYACVHQKLGPMESLSESWRLTEGAKGGLMILVIASMALLVAGLICLLVGVIPAAMVLALAQPFVYLSLLEQSGPRPGSALA
jgi:hypothetical protein